MRILIANEQIAVQNSGGYRQFITRLVIDRWRFSINWRSRKGSVKAEIVKSNWRVACPFCRGAVVIQPRKLYFCPDCANQANDFKPMLVLWPQNRAEIERVLLLRPDPLRRNWLPSETLQDLIDENNAHGIGGK